MKGAYVLLIDLPEPREISVGRLGTVVFPGGVYAYVGSALNGIEARVCRHLRKNKKLHWHIDYLLQQASIRKVVLYETAERVECLLAQYLSRECPGIPGFGSSDCRCHSHLYFESDSARLEEKLVRAFEILARLASPARLVSGACYAATIQGDLPGTIWSTAIRS